MNKKMHLRRARLAWPILVNAAKRQQSITYGDLTARLGLHWRAASWFLGVIQRHCAEAELPRLQALAVNKRTRRPGAGYAGARGPPAHLRELDRVHAHRWDRKPPF